MTWIVARFKPVMLVCGALTCTMLYAAVNPSAMLQGTFGETLEGPLAGLVVRNWGVLIALSGGMLIYGAFHPPVRPLVLTVAGLGKLAFIVLVLAQGGRWLRGQAAVAVACDAAMILLFAIYLFFSARVPKAPGPEASP